MEDIKWDRNQIFIAKGKGKKDRYVNLSQDFKNILAVYVHEYNPSHYLFEGQDKINQYSGRSIQNVVKKATSIAGITQKVSPHTLRHCFATHLLDAGTQLPYIKELLGHKDIKTTMIYTHITTSSIEKVVSPLDNLKIFGKENLEKPQP
jgi:integrase/recombinase XerD